MKKRVLMILLVISVCLFACACSDTENADNHDKDNDRKELREDKKAERDKNKSDIAEDDSDENKNKNESFGKSKIGVDILNDKTSDERYKLNVFMSNFSETLMRSYPTNDTSLISFAYTHDLINNNDEITYRDNNQGISAARVNETLDKYFGISVPLQSTETVYGEYTFGYEYSDGYFWRPAASGESYSYFSLVTSMIPNSDKTYTVEFETFHAGYDEDMTTGKYYRMSIEQAMNQCEYSYSGTATIKEKNYNGQNTYELVSYTRN